MDFARCFSRHSLLFPQRSEWKWNVYRCQYCQERVQNAPKAAVIILIGQLSHILTVIGCCASSGESLISLFIWIFQVLVYERNFRQKKIFSKQLDVICISPCMRNGLKDSGVENICGTEVLRKQMDNLTASSKAQKCRGWLLLSCAIKIIIKKKPTHLELLRKKIYIGPLRNQQAYEKGDEQEVRRTQPVKVSLLLPRKAMYLKNTRKENKMSS